MRIRYVLNGQPEVAEVLRMCYKGGDGYFRRADGALLKLLNVSEQEWLRLVADMFIDGSLNIPPEGHTLLQIECSPYDTVPKRKVDI